MPNVARTRGSVLKCVVACVGVEWPSDNAYNGKCVCVCVSVCMCRSLIYSSSIYVLFVGNIKLGTSVIVNAMPPMC